MKSFQYAQPRTVPGALGVLTQATGEVRIIAGGTDQLNLMKERTDTPDLLVNLKAIPGLDGIVRTERGLEIGALVKLVELIESPLITDDFPALAETSRKTATPQIRNVATIAGNLCQRPRCWYFRHPEYTCLKKGGDMCYAQEGENEYHAIFDNGTCGIIHPSNLAPVLIALDARIEVAGPDETRLVEAEHFFVSPGDNVHAENILAPFEMITKVILPESSRGSRCAYFEAREKQSYDLAVCGSTVRLAIDEGKVVDSRVVLSAVAPTPKRRRDLEEMLEGKPVDEALVNKVCKVAIQDATPLRDNAYKTTLLKATLRRALRKVLES